MIVQSWLMGDALDPSCVVGPRDRRAVQPYPVGVKVLPARRIHTFIGMGPYRSVPYDLASIDLFKTRLDKYFVDFVPKVLSHIGRILSRVGYVVFTFCPENQTDG